MTTGWSMCECNSSLFWIVCEPRPEREKSRSERLIPSYINARAQCLKRRLGETSHFTFPWHSGPMESWAGASRSDLGREMGFENACLTGVCPAGPHGSNASFHPAGFQNERDPLTAPAVSSDVPSSDRRWQEGTPSISRGRERDADAGEPSHGPSVSVSCICH
jgi:hypothetical protein